MPHSGHCGGKEHRLRAILVLWRNTPDNGSAQKSARLREKLTATILGHPWDGRLWSAPCTGRPVGHFSLVQNVQNLGSGHGDTLESPVLSFLRDVYAQFLPVCEGTVAAYIPELKRVPPDQFGIALVTADGHAYEVGDSRQPFTIQSISKPLVYGLALRDHGREGVLRRIGVEPSGDQFNAIVFDDRCNRPFNAMVNTGAIVATSLIRGTDPADRMARILEFMRVLSGHPVEIDEAVYRSEVATGNRNRAIAYLELNNGMIEGSVDSHLDLYFRQCAIVTTATDLAFIAATLARGGRHPVTGERVLSTEHVRDVLSVMTTCGMYDYAGEWELRVGLPAKSGVGGGIMAVLPGQLGIGIFSPRLDEHGNSVRGIRACEELSRRSPPGNRCLPDMLTPH